MIVEYLRYEIEDARAEGFVAAYRAASVPLRASPYCLGFELCRCDDEPSSFILRIEWTSAEDHMRGFRGSAEFQAFFADIRAYLGDIREMRHYTPLIG